MTCHSIWRTVFSTELSPTWRKKRWSATIVRSHVLRCIMASLFLIFFNFLFFVLERLFPDLSFRPFVDIVSLNQTVFWFDYKIFHCSIKGKAINVIYVYNLVYFTYATASLVHLRKSLGPVIFCCEALGNEQYLSYTPSHKTIFQRCTLTH